MASDIVVAPIPYNGGHILGIHCLDERHTLFSRAKQFWQHYAAKLRDGSSPRIHIDELQEPYRTETREYIRQYWSSHSPWPPPFQHALDEWCSPSTTRPFFCGQLATCSVEGSRVCVLVMGPRQEGRTRAAHLGMTLTLLMDKAVDCSQRDLQTLARASKAMLLSAAEVSTQPGNCNSIGEGGLLCAEQELARPASWWTESSRAWANWSGRSSTGAAWSPCSWDSQPSGCRAWQTWQRWTPERALPSSSSYWTPSGWWPRVGSPAEHMLQLATCAWEGSWVTTGQAQDPTAPTWDGADLADRPSTRKDTHRGRANTQQPPAGQDEHLALEPRSPTLDEHLAVVAAAHAFVGTAAADHSGDSDGSGVREAALEALADFGTDDEGELTEEQAVRCLAAMATTGRIRKAGRELREPGARPAGCGRRGHEEVAAVLARTRCSNCNQLGHRAKRCLFQEPRCSNCRQLGHSAEKCLFYEGAFGERTDPPWPRTRPAWA